MLQPAVEQLDTNIGMWQCVHSMRKHPVVHRDAVSPSATNDKMGHNNFLLVSIMELFVLQKGDVFAKNAQCQV